MWITSEWSHRTSIPVAGNPLDVADLRRVYVPPVVSPDRAPAFALHSRGRARARPALILVALGVAILLLSPALALAAAARVDHTRALGFEPVDGAPPPSLWLGVPRGPDGTLLLDSVTVHSGRYAGRLARDANSASSFSSFAYKLERTFGGDTLELRGWLKYEGVTGFAGLWQRQDGESSTEHFDNMESRGLKGDADWAEYRVRLPLSPRTRDVTVGALLVGRGRVWVDDLQLYVDGKPLADAPEYVVPKTVLDTDTGFPSGSKISLEKPTARQVENLVLLGKVWGFLKYHHPAVVRGQRHWDFDLFRITPRVLAAKDRSAAQRELVRWIASLGPVAPCRPCVFSPSEPALAARLGWISDRTLLGKELSARLVAIHTNRPDASTQFFVSLVPGVLNPDFRRELAYPELSQPDAGYRLLALFRYWNIIEYWFPYRDQIDGDWDATLREFIPRMLGAGARADYLRELIAMIARIHDSHANLWGGLDARPPYGNASLPVSVRFLSGRAVVSGYSNPRLGPATGLEVGDVLVAIAGTPVDSLVERWRPLYSASNHAARLRDMTRDLTRGWPGPVELSVDRDGQRLTLRPTRVVPDSIDRNSARTHDHPGVAFRRLSGDVAYLKLSSGRTADVGQYVSGMTGAKCVVIDIRNYPSEPVLYVLGQHMVKETTPFVKFTKGDTRNPGAFMFTPPLSLQPVGPLVGGTFAILVDEITQSHAEFTTMAFRARPGTLVVGSQTAGADGNVSQIPLPGAPSTRISGIGVFYPDGRPTQRIGIVPDLEVIPTPAGLRAGRDEVLEAAIRRVLGRDMTEDEYRQLRSDFPLLP